MVLRGSYVGPPQPGVCVGGGGGRHQRQYGWHPGFSDSHEEWGLVWESAVTVMEWDSASGASGGCQHQPGRVVLVGDTRWISDELTPVV